LTSIKNSIAAETIIQNFKNCYQNSEQLHSGGPANLPEVDPAICGIDPPSAEMKRRAGTASGSSRVPQIAGSQ